MVQGTKKSHTAQTQIKHRTIEKKKKKKKNNRKNNEFYVTYFFFLHSFTLPYRQFSFTFSFVYLWGNNITCKSKIGHFAGVIVGYQDVSGGQIAMNYLKREKNGILFSLFSLIIVFYFRLFVVVAVVWVEIVVGWPRAKFNTGVPSGGCWKYGRCGTWTFERI